MLFILFPLLLIVSCGNSVKFKEKPLIPTRNTETLKTVSFSEVSEKILKPSCIECHAGYSDYSTAYKAKNEILSSVLDHSMPRSAPALSDELKTLLSDWVNSPVSEEDAIGAGEDEISDELVATWSSLSKKIFFPKCVRCHNSSPGNYLMDLTTRQHFFDRRESLLNNFEDVENSDLVLSVSDREDPMPPKSSKLEMLTDKEINVIIEWIEKGLP